MVLRNDNIHIPVALSPPVVGLLRIQAQVNVHGMNVGLIQKTNVLIIVCFDISKDIQLEHVNFQRNFVGKKMVGPFLLLCPTVYAKRECINTNIISVKNESISTLL